MAAEKLAGTHLHGGGGGAHAQDAAQKLGLGLRGGVLATQAGLQGSLVSWRLSSIGPEQLLLPGRPPCAHTAQAPTEGLD